MNFKKFTPLISIVIFIVLIAYLNSQFGNIVAISFAILFILVLLIIFRYKTLTTLGIIFLAQSKSVKAEKIFKNIIAKNAKEPKAYLYYANSILHDGKATEAKEVLSKALLLKPDIITYKNIKLSLGSCYWLLNQIDDAIKVLTELQEEFEYINHYALTTLGFMHFLKDDYEKAKEITLLALEDNNESHSAWDNMGQIYYKEKDYQNAIEAFLKALSYKETLVDSLYHLGLIYEIQGDIDLAKEYLEKARLAPITSLNTVTLEEIEEKINSLNN